MEQALNPAGGWPAPIRNATIDLPESNPGETYIGAILNPDGTGHHIILMDGDHDCSSWQSAMDWAKSIGGDLPSRIELAMLYDNFRDQFKKDWYWSNTTVDGEDASAWYQDFLDGRQYDVHKDYGYCRARAVRRLVIK